MNRRAIFSLLLVSTLASSLALSACSSDDGEAAPKDAGTETDADADDDADTESDAEAPTECGIADCEYPELSLWQEPILDYIEATKGKLSQAKLRKSISDLIVFDDRLYFGYGDADLNAGRVTDILVRYFESPDATTYSAEPTKTDEEEIAQFRKFGDTLYIAGVDATEDGWLGNVFTKPSGGELKKHRTVTGGVHVHDIAVWKGDIYACGSGAPGADEWNTGQVYSYLWRSTDGAESFEAVSAIQNATQGDRRYVQMIPFPDELLLFGYQTNPEYKINALLSDSWDGTTLKKADKAPGYFIEQTDLFDEQTAIIRGVYAIGELKPETLVLKAGQAEAKVVEALTDKTVIDVFVIEPGKALVLAMDTIVYPLPKKPDAGFQVLYTEDFENFTTLVTSDVPAAYPTSVAYWHKGIYVGFAKGQIWRSVAE